MRRKWRSQSFADPVLEEFFVEGRVPKRASWTAATRVVARKLDMLHYAGALMDMASPPGNRLEPLKGKWKGLHSIRVNDQWRIVFRWTDSGPADVDVCDYH